MTGAGEPQVGVDSRKVLRDAIGTLVANGVALVALQVASILIVRMLGVTGRGEVALAVLIPTIIAYGGWLGLPVATGYLINAEPALRLRVIATARTVALALSLALGLLSVVLSALLPLHPGIRAASIVFALFIPLNLFVAIHQAIVQADLRNVAFNLVRVSGAVLYVVVLLGLDLFDAASTTTVILAQLGGNIAWCIPFAVLTRSRPWFAFDKGVARSLLGYGLRAHLSTCSPVDALKIDQLILGLFLSTYDLGLYVIAMTLVIANRMIGVSIGMVAFPVASRFAAGSDLRQKGRVILGSLIGGTLLLAVIAAAIEIVFGRQLLRLLFDVRTDEAYEVLTILVVASIFMNGRAVVSDVLRGLGRPGVTTVSELVSLGALLTLALALWSRGLIGVAWAVSLSAAVAFLFVVLAGLIGGRGIVRTGSTLRAPANARIQGL